MISPVLAAHYERFKVRYPNANLTNLQNGAALISVPSCRLPSGWSAQEVTLRFIAPNGYSVAAPDCFWVEPNLAINGRDLPKNSAINNQIPEAGILAHWFSWHVVQGHWLPNQHDLLTWMSMCLMRLQTPE
ncbi:MAG: E2/UBC family protein [Methylocella sp.]